MRVQTKADLEAQMTGAYRGLNSDSEDEMGGGAARNGGGTAGISTSRGAETYATTQASIKWHSWGFRITAEEALDERPCVHKYCPGLREVDSSPSSAV